MMKICSVENCGIKSRTKGFCPKHYYRFKHNLDLNNDCKRIFNEEQEKEIVKLYKTGDTNCNKLGQMFGVKHWVIRDCLVRAKIPMKKGRERTYSVDENFFEKIDTKEKAYFLGLLYSDGCNFEKRGNIVIHLQEGDAEILNRFKEVVNTTKPLYVHKRKNEKHQTLLGMDICSPKMSKDLVKLGCVQRKSLIIKFPTKEQVPDHLFWHYLRGVFDGDGGYYISAPIGKTNRRRCGCYITSTYDFCKALKEKLESMNIECNMWTDYKKSNITTTIRIYESFVLKFSELMYKDSENLRLTRKYNKYMEYVDYDKTFVPFRKRRFPKRQLVKPKRITVCSTLKFYIRKPSNIGTSHASHPSPTAKIKLINLQTNLT